MVDVRIDRQRAAAEAALDRFDDGEILAQQTSDAGSFEFSDGMHVEDGNGSWVVEDNDDEHAAVSGLEPMDVLCEAFNARDFDAIRDLCSRDCETPGLASGLGDLADTLDDLWERRPTVTMTRGVHDDVAVGVLWEREDGTGWAPVATLHVDTDVDGVIGVIEVTEDSGLLDLLELEPPDGDLVEGARWEEWEEGAD